MYDVMTLFSSIGVVKKRAHLLIVLCDDVSLHVANERKRGVCFVLQWSCCDIHVKEFDEFMAIPPCTVGWHSS